MTFSLPSTSCLLKLPINHRAHNEAFAFSFSQTNLQFHLLYFTLLLFCLIIYNLLFQVFNISVLFACVQVKCSIAIQYTVTDGIQWIINQLQLPEATRIFTFTRIGIFQGYLQGNKVKRKRYLFDDTGQSLNYQIISDKECNLQAKLQNPCRYQFRTIDEPHILAANCGNLTTRSSLCKRMAVLALLTGSVSERKRP